MKTVRGPWREVVEAAGFAWQRVRLINGKVEYRSPAGVIRRSARRRGFNATIAATGDVYRDAKGYPEVFRTIEAAAEALAGQMTLLDRAKEAIRSRMP